MRLICSSIDRTPHFLNSTVFVIILYIVYKLHLKKITVKCFVANKENSHAFISIFKNNHIM